MVIGHRVEQARAERRSEAIENFDAFLSEQQHRVRSTLQALTQRRQRRALDQARWSPTLEQEGNLDMERRS